MCRSSPFVITLPDADRAELERRARCYTLPHAVVVRAKIVLLAAEGLENTQIAARLGVHVNVVSRWRGRFARAVLDGLGDRRGPGWPGGVPGRVGAGAKAPAERLPGSRRRVGYEFESVRGVSVANLAAYDVHRVHLMGRVEPTPGIAPFAALGNQVMSREPYAWARRVFWVADNGCSHRGQASVRRLAVAWPNAALVHLPVHASWVNQIEIVFSVIQRKVITPAEFNDSDAPAARLLAFQDRYNATAAPFDC